MKKVGIIGSGNVGANAAFFIAENHTASVTLVDTKEGLSVGKSLDMLEAGPIRHYDTDINGADSIEGIRGSDIVVIAAGRVRAPDQSRDDLFKENSQPLLQVCEDIKKLAPDSVVINVMEPVDMITLLAQKSLGFDRGRVLGVGGLLSSMRLRYFISNELGVSSREVTGIVIGPHRPTMVFLRDTIRVSGIPVDRLLPTEKIDSILSEVRKAGDDILHMAQLSTAYYAPSAAVAGLAAAIARDSKEILPVSLRLQGEYGLGGVAMSVPAQIGSNGVDRIVAVKMSQAETRELVDAANDLCASLARVDC
jgi:malate dehydrogenase